MIRFTLILCMILIQTVPTIAQTISVRSGEHDEFTRIVLRIPRETVWSLETQNAQAKLSVEISKVEFDTGDVFSRIPRERITNVSQAFPGAPLVFGIGCDCKVSAEIQGGTLLVMDVRGPKEGSNPSIEPPRTFGLEMGKPLQRPLPSPYKFVLRQPKPARQSTNVSKQLTSPQNLKLVNAMEQRLLDQIKRASDQGLIKAEIPGNQVIGSVQNTDRPQREKAAPSVDAKDSLSPNNIAITTSIDRDLDQISNTLRHKPINQKCLSDQNVGLSKWGDGRMFGTQISFWRSKLVGEFDQPDPDAIVSLAQTYLYFGFGAEASQTLSLLPQYHPEADVLKAVAETIDHSDRTPDTVFSGQHNCDGDVAMWAVLSDPGTVGAAKEAAVLKAFSRLPTHLRQYIGPRLSRIFSDAGKAETAQAILRPIVRIDDEPSAALTMAQAAAATLKGDHDKAIEQRKSIARTSTEQAPLALIELINHAEKTQTAVPPDLVELIGTYAVELKRSELGSDLRKANAVALAIAGNFTDSFEQLDDIKRLDGEVTQDEARYSVLAILSDRADDITFLKHSFSDLNNVDRKIPESVGNRLAKRLLKLGFPKAAIQVLTGTDLQVSSPERRLLRARAAIVENLPHQALVALLGLGGQQAAELRGKAFLQIKNYDGAAKSLSKSQQTGLATRSRWLAGTSNALDADATGRYGSIANLSQLLSSDALRQGENGPLAQSHSLIEASQTARRNIADLLQVVNLEQP